MKKIFFLALILLALALIASYMIFKKDQDRKAGKAAISEEYEKLIPPSDDENPEAILSPDIQKLAIQRIEQIIDEQPSLEKKRQAAASTFMGFYLTNYRTRSDYCESLNVALTNFKQLFHQWHEKELDIAKGLLFQSGNSIDEFYGLIQTESFKAISQDMEDLATIYQVTPEEACKKLEENAETLTNQMQLSKMQPLVYEYLHNLIPDN